MGMPEALKNKIKPTGGEPTTTADAPKDKPSKTPIPVTMVGMDSRKIEGVLRLYEPMFATALMGAIPPERMVQVSTSILADNDRLKACSTKSIIGAVLSASLIGLDPTPELGLVYFVPRKSKCCLEIGYMGWLNLMHRNPIISHIFAYVVRDTDKFEVRLGLEPRIDHVPNLDKPGNLKYVYAVAQLTNGQRVFRYLNQNQVEARRDRSEAKDSNYSPWNDKVLVEEMWAKTAIKVLRKFIPITLESRIATAIAVDGQSIMPETIDLDKKSVKITESDFDDAIVVSEQTSNGKNDNDGKKAKAEEKPKPDEKSETTLETTQSTPAQPETGLKAEKPHNRERFLKALAVHQRHITEMKGEAYWRDLPGRFGMTSFTEVPPEEEVQYLVDLAKITTDLARATAQQDAKQQQGSLL